MDTVSPSVRSKIMGRIRSKDTQPELIVRRAAHALGYRFRLHRHDLPGSPDLVFPSRRIALFVHGCFWHRHIGCKYCYEPKSRIQFWKNKFSRNVLRDARVEKELQEMGWRVGVLWECEVSAPDSLRDKLRAYLDT